MKVLEKLLEPFKVIYTINVEWGEMDAAQHVNNTIYLKWSESARIAYFQKMNMDITSAGHGVSALPSEEGIILGYVDCKYIFPVTFPDQVKIGVKVAEIKADRIVIESHLFSVQNERIVAISKQEVLPYNYIQRKKIPVSKGLIEKIEAIEKKSF